MELKEIKLKYFELAFWYLTQIEPTSGFRLVWFACLRLPPEVINIYPGFPGYDFKCQNHEMVKYNDHG